MEDDSETVPQRKARFRIRSSKAIFTAEEIEVLERYGNFFDDLMNRRCSPVTDAQLHFQQVCEGTAKPESEYEKLWIRYLKRIALEANPGNQSTSAPRIRINGDGFGGSREAVKEMRRQHLNEIRERNQDD